MRTTIAIVLIEAVFLFVLITTDIEAKPNNRRLAPIVFIPGQGGNRIEGRFDKTFEPYQFGNFCLRKRNWHTMWLNLVSFFFNQHCVADNLKLVFNSTTGKSLNSRGVEIRIPYFGRTEGVEYLYSTILLKKYEKYAAPFFKNLVKLGYTKNSNLVAAPYDFRRGAYRQLTFDSDLKKLVEKTYSHNGKKRVLVITHSLGGLMGHQFLTAQSQQWKKRYVRALITMSSPWGGAVKSMKVFTSGINFGIKLIDPLVVRKLYRTFESSTEAFPNRHGFNSNKVLVQTPHKNYSISNFGEYFSDLGRPEGLRQYHSYKDHFDEVLGREHPGVDTYVMYSKGVDTIERLVYGSGYPDSQPTSIAMGDGDGTVNEDSLRAPRRWSSLYNKLRYGFHEVMVPNANHKTIMESETVLNLVSDINGRAK